MRILPLLLLALPLFGTTTLENISVSNTQATLDIRTDQTGSCTVKVSTVNDFSGSYAPVNDVNTTYFPGSDSCSRTGNIVSGNRYQLVIGTRTADLDATGKYKQSRSLEQQQQFFYSISIGSDTLTGSFNTGNTPLGLTRNDTRFDRTRPGEYLYPSMDWSTSGEGKTYIDPQTGMAAKRIMGPGTIFPGSNTGRTFSTPTGGSGWSGLTWTGTGVGSNLYLRATSPDPIFTIWQSVDSVQLKTTLSGSAPSVEVCLTNDGVNCAGGRITQAITGTPTAYTIGTTTAIQDSWRNGPNIPSAYPDVQTAGYLLKDGVNLYLKGGPSTFSPALGSGLDIVIGTTACSVASTSPGLVVLNSAGCLADGYYNFSPGTLTKSGTAVTWTGGALFNLDWSAGTLLTLGTTTDCAIASITNEKALVLSSSGCIADGDYNFQGRSWGLLLRSTGTGTVTVASSPVYDTNTSGVILGASSGIPKYCSGVHVASPPGWVCAGAYAGSAYLSTNPIFHVGDDGTVTPIAPSFASPGASGLTGASCGGDGLIWDGVEETKYWCMGNLISTGKQVLYSIKYPGGYSPIVIPFDGQMSGAIVTVESTDLDAAVAAFTASDPVKYSDFPSPTINGWHVVSQQGGYIVILNWLTFQDSVSWIAIFDPATHSIVAALSTYGGGSNTTNRWCTSHTINIAGESPWILDTCNSPSYTSLVTSGTLPLPYSTCPTNTVDPSLNGTLNCGTVTLDSITPLSGGLSLFSQPYKLGDYAFVQDNGTDAAEIVRFLTISGTTVGLQRNARPYADQYNCMTAPFCDHTGTLTLRTSAGAWHEMWWNFLDDPHAQTLTESYGPTIRADPNSANCHEVWENDLFIEGCLQTTINYGKAMRLGALPESGDGPGTFDATPFIVNSEAGFAGSTFQIGANYDEQHPSIGQRLASDYEKPIWLDNRPYAGDPNITASGCVSSVTGNVYKVSNTCTTALNYRQQGLLGMAGVQIMVDASPTVITNTSPDAFKYCYVVIAGDCYAASSVGEIYFNIPQLTSTSVIISRFVDYPGNLIRDVTFTQNVFTVSNTQQGKAIGPDEYGRTVRRLTTSLGIAKIQPAYWNTQATPDNHWFWGSNIQQEYARVQSYLFKMPPWPNEVSTNLGTFINVPVIVNGNSGDSFRVRFGYAENGAITSLYCHERQSACSTDATGTQPFLWADETQQWQSCMGQCTVNIPAIGQRVLYYILDRKDGSGNVASSGIKRILVP